MEKYTKEWLNRAADIIERETHIHKLNSSTGIHIPQDEYFLTVRNIFELPLVDFSGNFLAIIPELFLFTVIIFLLVYGLIFSTNKTNANIFILQETIWLSILSLILTLFLVMANPFTNFAIFHNSLIIDNISNIGKMITLTAIIITLLISFNYLKTQQINSYEYSILILISTLGTMFLISSYDLLSLYLALETQTLAFYVLTTFNRTSAYSTEAGLKYFILGALSSGMLLFGISLIYGITGTVNLKNLFYISEYYNYITTNFDTFAEISQNNLYQTILDASIEFKAYILGILFLICALFFKLSAAPFHMWAPDVYEGAPTSITGFFAIVPKLGIFLVIIRLLYNSFFSISYYIEFVLIVCAGLSMIIGSLGALQQQKLKRLFVYSSISHVGYMLIGLTSSTLLGLQGLFLYLLIYMITNINIWTIFLSLKFKNNSNYVKYISDFTGLAKTNPILAFSLTIALCSMAGIPPLAGFYPKLLMFMAAFQAQTPILAFIGVFSSLLGAYYYLRIIKIMYFETPLSSIEFKDIGQINAYIISITTLILLFFFLLPNPILFLTHKMAFFNFI